MGEKKEGEEGKERGGCEVVKGKGCESVARWARGAEGGLGSGDGWEV